MPIISFIHQLSPSGIITLMLLLWEDGLSDLLRVSHADSSVHALDPHRVRQFYNIRGSVSFICINDESQRDPTSLK